MTTQNRFFIFLISFITLLVFVIDVSTPKGINEGYFYVIPILITLWIPGKKYTINATIAGAILTFIGFYFSAEGVAIQISIANRLLAVLGSIITMFTVLKNKEKEKLIEKKNQELEKLILELKNSNSELEQYVYLASHDLQEPLRNITNYINLLETRLKNGLDVETSQFMDRIKKFAEKMKILIQSIILFSQIGEKRILEKVDCNKLINQILTEMESYILENKAKIKVDNLPVIESNQLEIKQLLQHLVSNAIKFKKKDTTPEIQIHCEDRNNKWEFSIADNGIGIREEYFNKLFIVFQRLRPESEYPGAGIGLAICKKIIKLNNGEIWVKSQPNIGSTFYFTIPKHQI